jgi:hypothetical protein
MSNTPQGEAIEGNASDDTLMGDQDCYTWLDSDILHNGFACGRFGD